MRVILLFCSLTITLLLSACGRPEATITITIKIPPKLTATVGGSSPTVGMTGSIVGQSSILDASAMSLDVSNSTIVFPSSGTVTLRLLNLTGGLVRTGTFAWTRLGTSLKFSSPSTVNSWLQTSGADPSTSRIDYAFTDFVAPMLEEENLVVATVEIYNQPIVSGASSYRRGGGHCTPRCVPE